MEREKIEREIEYSSKSPSQKHEFSIEDEENILLIVPPTVYPPREDTKLLYQALQKLRTSGGHLVEIGCGSGAISIAMAIAGWRVSAPFPLARLYLIRLLNPDWEITSPKLILL